MFNLNFNTFLYDFGVTKNIDMKFIRSVLLNEVKMSYYIDIIIIILSTYYL